MDILSDDWESRFEYLRQKQELGSLAKHLQQEYDGLEQRVREVAEHGAELRGRHENPPHQPEKRKRVRAAVEPLAIVTVLESYGVALSSTEPGQLNHERCPFCYYGDDCLSVRINEDGGGAWECKRCTWHNKRGEVRPNRKKGHRRAKPHWYDALPPEGQAWFAHLLRERCSSKLSTDAQQDFGLIDPDGRLRSGDELVQAVKQLLSLNADRRFARLWSSAVRAFKGELGTAAAAAKEVTGKRGWPPKWITRDRAIKTNLARKGNRKLLDLYWLLRDARWPFARCEKWKFDVDTYPVLVEVPYERAQRELSLSYEQVNRHLRAMAAHNIIRDGRVRGSEHGQKLWILGTWAVEGLHPTPSFMLKNCIEMRQALRQIDVWATAFQH